MSNVIIIYDDHQKTPSRIKSILGEKSFGEMILKRQSMFTRMKKISNSIPNTELIRLKDLESFDPATLPPNAIYLHLLSSSAIVSQEEFILIIKKIAYAKDNLTLRDANTIYGGIFKNRSEYISFIKEYKNQDSLNFLTTDAILTNCFADLTNYNTLLMYISSGFDARYFNSLHGDSYTVTKRSSDKKKMKMEYNYYWLLPESMKMWMVMPYNLQEGPDWASYTMERMPMTDIAIRWTHGAVNNEELKNILEKTFYFFSQRTERKVSKEAYQKNAEKLYITKIDDRIADFKKQPEYKKISELIEVGTDYNNIDDIITHYKDLYRRITKKIKNAPKSVIGHGDVFFANMLYSKELGLLRLIDPKGALTKDDLWMDPYYDIAKLSHSICGNYDFFNTGSYSIDYDKNLKFKLNVFTDNSKAKELFKSYLEKNGYSYTLTRLYEASLFLSMLPLHIDNPHKVFGFILNAISILEEIEQNV